MPSWLIKLFGKKLVENGLERHGISKAKVTAIIGATVLGYNQLAPVFQWPPIPAEIFRYLEMFGLWTLRDAIKTNA